MGKNINNTESPERNHIKIFLYLFCAVLLLISIFVLRAIYFNRNNYKIHNIVIRPSVQRFGRDFSKEIQTTKVFVERFINSYQDVIEKEVNSDFKESFTLSKGKKLSAKVIFSAVSEAFLGVYQSPQNELIVECTKYPVQMALFSGIDCEDPKSELLVSYEDAIKAYNDCPVAFRLEESVQFFLISDLQFRSDCPEYFSFAKNALVTLSGIGMKTKLEGGVITMNIDINNVVFITGEKDFSFAIEKAEALGKFFGESQIERLFAKSKFFRLAKIEEHLEPKAKEIGQNVSRSEKDPQFKYPYWKFKKDVAELEGEAKKYGIDTSYIDDLLKYPSNQPKDGYLLWYYPNHFWFSVQWIAVNIVLLVVFSIIVIVERTDYKIAALMNRWWSKLSIHLSLNVILLSINAWIFVGKPKYLNIKYWIIPGVLLIACFLITVLTSKNKEQNP